LAAVGAFALGIGVVVLTVRFVAETPFWVVVQLALLTVATLAAWHALTRLGWRHADAVVIALAAVFGSLLVGVAGGGPVTVAIRIAALVLAVSLARYALALDVRSLRRRATPGVPVPSATRGVLIVNLRSGAGGWRGTDSSKRAGSGASRRSCSGRATTCSGSRETRPTGAPM
jgi:hypothetical protein